MNSFQKQLLKITSSFEKTIKDLDSLISSTDKEIEYKTDLISQLTLDNAELTQTKTKAASIKNNIKKLIGE